MNGIFLIVIVVLLVALYMYGMKTTVKEHFTNVAECPKEAVRTPDGKINVGDTIFSTMTEYVNYLNGLYANGASCIPPKVTKHNSPIDGILGGLGNGAEPPQAFDRQGGAREVLDYKHTEETSAKTPIKKLDDYEYTRVFNEEKGSRTPISKESTSALLTSRVLDWATLPFNSEARADKEDTFVSGRMDSGFRDPQSGVFFKNLDSVQPPDMDAEHQREQKLLSAYRPTEVSEHRIDSETQAVGKLVHEMYAGDQNWEPVVTKVNDYQWEVTELRPKPRKEQYEEEKSKNLALAQERGETLPPPNLSIDDRLRADPYFDKAGVGDNDNNKFWKYDDFKKWTPGLERMFAPTFDNQKWY